MNETHMLAWRGALKRATDITGSAVSLAGLFPVIALVAIAIRMLDPGPVIFRQQRVGKNMQLFELYKFRSMPVDTGDLPSDRVGSLTLSPIGRFIRRTNLDELPQLWNILRGDMSLVGPRPALPSQNDLLILRAKNGAASLKPGLTGLAQINSYDGMDVASKARFDGEYAANASLRRGIAIVLATCADLLIPPPKY